MKKYVLVWMLVMIPIVSAANYWEWNDQLQWYHNLDANFTNASFINATYDIGLPYGQRDIGLITKNLSELSSGKINFSIDVTTLNNSNDTQETFPLFPNDYYSNYSFCFWHYYRNFTPETNTKEYTPFIMTGSPTGEGTQVKMYYRNSTGTHQINFDVWLDQDNDLIPEGSISILNNLSTQYNSWTFVCGVKEGNNAYLYMNGTNQTNISVTRVATINGSDLFTQITLGNYRGWGNNFPGKIDEVGFWNQSLNATEISDLYNDGYGWTYLQDVFDYEQYEGTVYSDQVNTFQVDFVLDRKLYQNTTAIFIYNGTGYSPVETETLINATHVNISYVYTMTSPNVTTSEEQFTFYWNMTINYSWQPSKNYLSDSHNQTVQRAWLDGCDNASNITANFSFYNEDNTVSYLSSDYELNMEFWIPHSSVTQVYNETGTGKDYFTICIEDNKSVQANIYVLYSYGNSFSHRYYIYNGTFNNTVQTFELFNFLNTSDKSNLQLTSRYVSSYNYFPNVVAKLLRFYPGANLWKVVQMDQSGDFGNIVFHIKEQDTDYRMIFLDKQNHVLKTTDVLKFLCNSGLCELTVLLDPYSAGDSSENLNITYSFNAATNMLVVNWNNVLGETSTVSYEVTKETMTDTLTLCNASQTGAAGTLNCNLTGYEGQVYMSIEGDDTPKVASWIDKAGEKLSDVLSAGSSGFWAFMIMLVIVMFGLVSPVFVVVASVFGLIVVFFMGLYTPLSMVFLIVSIALGLLISLKVRT